MSEWPLWEVFIRGQNSLNYRHVGSLHAVDAKQALRNARDVYTRRHEGVSIWVARAQDIVASRPSANGPEFAADDARVYPHPSFDEAGPA